MRQYGQHFGESEKRIIDQLCLIFGGSVVSAMLQCAGAPEQQIELVNSYSKYETAHFNDARTELDRLGRENTALSDQLSQTSTQRMHETELLADQLRQSQVAQQSLAAKIQSLQSNPSPSSKMRTVKLDVAKYEGKDSDNLLRWLLKVSIAAEAQLISDDDMRVAFAMSHLGGRAEEWAYTQRLADSNCFPT